MKRIVKLAGIGLVVSLVALGVYQLGVHDGAFGGGNWLTGVAEAAAGTNAATAAVDPRDVYYPGSEAIAPDEFRVVACGTGMPNARPKQAAACWLVELGNGDKFIFDIGLGSAERLSAQHRSTGTISTRSSSATSMPTTSVISTPCGLVGSSPTGSGRFAFGVHPAPRRNSAPSTWLNG